MSGSALRERAALLDELHQIVLAMKNLAFAELQRIGRQVEALQPALATVLQALAEVEALAAASAGSAGSGHASAPTRRAGAAVAPVGWWLIGAERGFCGAYNSHLAEAARALHAADPAAPLWLASRRLQGLLDDLPAGVAQGVPGCAAIEDVEDTLDTWLAALAQAAGRCGELWLLHADEAGLVCQRLWPQPGSARRWTAAAAGSARRSVEGPAIGAAATAGPAGDPLLRRPRHHLPLPQLQAVLLKQALQLHLRAALMTALEQENHWRLAQMQRAQDHLDELGRELRQRYAVLRQAEITDELETLMSSMDNSAQAAG